MSRPSHRVPLTPKEGWLSDGRQVLHFLPTHWERTYQRLEINSGERLPGEQVPLLKNRRKISRDEALKLWATQAPGWLKPKSAPDGIIGIVHPPGVLRAIEREHYYSSLDLRGRMNNHRSEDNV